MIPGAPGYEWNGRAETEHFAEAKETVLKNEEDSDRCRSPLLA